MIIDIFTNASDRFLLADDGAHGHYVNDGASRLSLNSRISRSAASLIKAPALRDPPVAQTTCSYC